MWEGGCCDSRLLLCHAKEGCLWQAERSQTAAAAEAGTETLTAQTQAKATHDSCV